MTTCAEKLRIKGRPSKVQSDTHSGQGSLALMENRHNEADPLTDFLQEVKERAHYHYWLFGHYHDNRAIDEKHILLWEQIVQVI